MVIHGLWNDCHIFYLRDISQLLGESDSTLVQCSWMKPAFIFIWGYFLITTITLRFARHTQSFFVTTLKNLLKAGQKGSLSWHEKYVAGGHNSAIQIVWLLLHYKSLWLWPFLSCVYFIIVRIKVRFPRLVCCFFTLMYCTLLNLLKAGQERSLSRHEKCVSRDTSHTTVHMR